jgi:hypothetical protein
MQELDIVIHEVNPEHRTINLECHSNEELSLTQAKENLENTQVVKSGILINTVANLNLGLHSVL